MGCRAKSRTLRKGHLDLCDGQLRIPAFKFTLKAGIEKR
jgi:hypothetical protein